jgi:hypothetical protein
VAFTLADYANVETDTLRKSVLDTLLMESDVLQDLPWETIGALATTIVRIQDLPSVGFRRVNEGYSSSDGTLEQNVETISLMGLYADVDKAIIRAKNNIQDARALQQQMMVKAMSYNFNDKFINGDPETDPDEFKGLEQRVGDLNSAGFTSQYIDNGGTSGDGVNLNSAERQNFLDKFEQAQYSIKGHNPEWAYMNNSTLRVTRSILRREGLLDTTKDQFDRVVNMYGSTKLSDIGVKADQTTEILPNSETLEDAGAAESTSIYFCKYGIGEFFWGIEEYPMEVEDIGRLEGSPVWRTEVDWPVGLAQADPYSIARLYAIIPNATT